MLGKFIKLVTMDVGIGVRLEKISKKKGISMNALIVEIIREYLEE